MKTSHEIASKMAEKLDELTLITKTANAEKRDLKENKEFKKAKSEYDSLKLEHENTQALEEELRSMPTEKVFKETKSESDLGLGTFAKTGELRYLGAGTANGNAELARSSKYSNVILSAINNNVLMRQKARIETVSGKSFIDNVKTGGVNAGFSVEGAAYADSSNIKISQREYSLYKLTGIPKITEEVVYQSDIVNLENMLTEEISNSFSEVQETAFWYGTGNNQPKGLMTETFQTAKVTDKITQIETEEFAVTITPSQIFSIVSSLKSKFIKKAEWYMSREMWQVISGLTDTNGVPLIGPLNSKFGLMLAGYPVNIVDEFSDNETEKSRKVIFGDMSEAYQIVDSTAPMTIDRDNITSPEFVKFPTRTLVGGGMRNAQAIKCLFFKV